MDRGLRLRPYGRRARRLRDAVDSSLAGRARELRRRVKICLTPSDPSGPGYYRLLFPATYLEKAGHEILLPPYKVVGPDANGNKTVHFLAGWPVADIYVIQRRM